MARWGWRVGPWAWVYPMAWAMLLGGLCGVAHAQVAVPSGVNVPMLAQHITWQRLLHVDPTTGQSQINSPEFFLSPQGRQDPTQELQATLMAYRMPWGGDGNAHPRCRFPARYAWLAKQGVALPGYRVREPRCARLERWARFDHLRSVSLVLVSGYFGNPASTFGHAMLKFNTDDMPAAQGLLDMSVNFGAVVPDHEATVIYVLRGLFGGYQAGFSDQEHYSNDLVYGRTEFRDMWDHELQLQPAERDLLVMHLAEVAGKRFDYYFLTRNCGLRLAELVELATGRQVVASARAWYVPVELFHALGALDEQGPRLLAGAPRFVPSAERVLAHGFAQLNDAQRQVAGRLVREGATHVPQELAGWDADAAMDVLDVLLAYQAYRLIADGESSKAHWQREKQLTLQARLRWPARHREAVPMPEVPSPAQGHAPMRWGLGWGHDAQRGPFARLQWAAFSYELAGFHGLGQNELAVLDADLAVGVHQPPRLLNLDLLRVRKLNTRPVAIEGERDLSWQLQLGARRVGADERLQNHASGGVGRAWQSGAWTGVAMLNASLQSGKQPASWEPQLGLLWQHDRLHGVVWTGWRHPLPEGGKAAWNAQSSLYWKWSRDQSWTLQWQREGRSRCVVGFQQYW